jgi:hypothetical protein
VRYAPLLLSLLFLSIEQIFVDNTKLENIIMKFKRPKKTYADKLMGGLKPEVMRNPPQKTIPKPTEWLVGCVLKRNDEWVGQDQRFRSHSELRRFLKDENPYQENRDDEAGFITNRGNILSRREASFIAANAGQIPQSHEGRGILSSDILRWTG